MAQMINAADFGLKESVDATLPLRRALEACRVSKAGTLMIPAGRYRLSPKFATDFYCTPSNQDRGLQRVALLVKDCDGLTIEAKGAEFLFNGQMVPFVVINSRNVTLRGFTIDWEKLLVFQGRVTATNPEDNSFDLKVHPDCVTCLYEGALLHGDDPEEANHYWPLSQDLTWSRWYDPINDVWSGGSPYRGEVAYRAWNPGKELFATVQDLGKGNYRFFNATENLPTVGHVLMAKGMRTPNRRSPAIWISGSTGTRIEDVTIHHAGGMGIIAEQSRDVLLKRLRITPRPESGRLVSVSADATHFSSCAGLIEFDHCLFERMLDDGTNVHGIYMLAESVFSKHQVVARIGHFQHAGHFFAAPGDKVRFVVTATLRPVQVLTVESVERINTHRLMLTFREPLEPNVPEGMSMENLTWTPDVHMHHTVIRSNVARSLLVDSPGRVVLEDNQFIRPSEYNIGGGPDPAFWCESGSLQDVTIRRNVFELGREGAAVDFGGGVHPMAVGYHRNVTIEDNIIHTCGGPILRLSGVEHFIFKGNRIASTSPMESEAGVILNNCRDGVIRDNEVEGTHHYLVEMLGDTTDIRIENPPAFRISEQAR